MRATRKSTQSVISTLINWGGYAIQHLISTGLARGPSLGPRLEAETTYSIYSGSLSSVQKQPPTSLPSPPRLFLHPYYLLDTSPRHLVR